MANEPGTPADGEVLDQEVVDAGDLQPEGNDYNTKVVSLSAMIGDKPADGSTENTATSAKSKPDASGATQKPKQGERLFTQADLDRIINDRLTQERNKPAYQYGAAAITARAKRDGVTEQEAFTRIRNEENARVAKEYAENPEKAYQDMLNGTFNPYAPQQQPAQQQPQQPTQTRYTAENVAETLESLEASGSLPPGFNHQAVTKEFVIDAMQNGVKDALYNWMMNGNSRPATRDSVVTEMERRKNIPRTMQSSGGQVAPRSVSPKSMSAEEFKKLDQEIESGNRGGYAVRLGE